MRDEIRELIDELRRNKCAIKLNASGNINLSVADKTKLPNELLTKVKKNKAGLIEYLKFSIQPVELTIEKIAHQENYPISDAQRRMWVLSQFEESAIAYHLSGSVYLNQNTDIECFKKAIMATIDRHEILRTVFKEDQTGEVRQWIIDSSDLIFEIDFKDFNEKGDSVSKDVKVDQWKNQYVQTYINEDANKPFDLEKGPLLRAAILKVGEDEYVFYHNMHHIISDGWSMGVLAEDVFKYYEAFKENKSTEIIAHELPELRIQYKDYSVWQHEQLNQAQFKEHKAYWLKSLSGELPLINLPSSTQRPKLKTINGQRLGTYIDADLSQNLKKYSEENGGSLFMGLLAVWNVLIYRYTAEKDILIGTPIAGREHGDLENQIGFYVNSLVFRNQVEEQDSFHTFYQRLKENTLKSYSHQMYPFDRLVEELELHRNTSRSAVFDIMLKLQNIEENKSDIGLAKMTKEVLNQIVDNGYDYAKFDLDLTFQEFGDYLSWQIVYNTDVYEREMVERLMSHFKQLLTVLLENPDTTIAQVDYLLPKEKHELLVTLNKPEGGGFIKNGLSPDNVKIAELDTQETIVALFESQAEKNPDSIALIFSGKKETKDEVTSEIRLTYKDLNDRSNQFAGFLHKKVQIQPNDLVGIQLERSEWMIISILGVLKAGGAYVPIDPNYPQDRKDFIKQDTNYKICINEAEINRFKQEQESYAATAFFSKIKEDSLAYVIYTSGSTGAPKGVMIAHANLRSFIASINFGDAERIAASTNLTFDISGLEIWAALCYGKELVLLSKRELDDPHKFLERIEETKVEGLQLTPSRLSLIYSVTDRFPNCVSSVIVGGEALTENLYNRLKQESFESINAYGPTETTIWSTALTINQSEKLSIGIPLPNQQVYILNEKNELQPKGVIGEMCISGAGVAIGYLNREEITNEKFIKNPFNEGTRLYKTGDLGKWNAAGNIEFIGRKDDQVKIRGHRIELGEIEHTLLKNTEVNEAAVRIIDGKENEKELVAYITAKKELTATDLRTWLKKYLPDYMLPNFYLQLEEMPLNTSAKIDKKALPNPERAGLKSGVEYIAARNELEEELVKIWEQVLQREKIGIKDDFFALGGHSLKAIRLLNEYQKLFDVKLSINQLFSHTTLEYHSQLIKEANKQAFIEIPVISELEKENSLEYGYPISDAQRRLWVLNQLDEGSIAYSMPGSIMLNEKLDLVCFRKAIQATIERHEVLRTLFKENENGDLRQWVLNTADVTFEVDYKNLRNVKDKENEVQKYINEDSFKPFDLANGPLLRAAILQVEDEKFVFYYNMHHIISDGWSMEVLSSDVFKFYQKYTDKNESEQQDIHLENLRIQYKDYSAWRLAQLETDSFNAYKAYWLKDLSGELPVLNLPGAKERPDLKTSRGRSLSTYIDANTTEKLKQFTEKNGGSQFIGILAVWNALLYRYTGQSDMIIGTPIAGREHPDLENQIGCYVNTLVLRNEVKSDQHFTDFYKQIKEKTVKSYDRQMYPFDRLIEELNLPRDTSRNAVFDLMISYRNAQGNGKKLTLEKDVLSQIVDLGVSTSKFDLDVSFQEMDTYLSLHVTYNSDVYDKSIIEGLINHFKQFLKTVLDHSGVKIAEIDYLSEAEKKEQLITFNSTEIAYPQDKSIVDLFEEQALKIPNNIAVVVPQSQINKQLTYQELNGLANQLANYLDYTYQIKPGDLIGIKQERNEWMIISMLAILKLGAGYVPIDFEYPQDRIDFIEGDVGCEICIDKVVLNAFIKQQENYTKEAVSKMTSSDDPAYVIYTSGSTGKPKGVLISRNSLTDYVHTFSKKFEIGSEDIVIQQASISFDVAVEEIFPTLCSGARLIILPNGAKNIEALIHVIESEKATVLSTVPIVISEFNQYVQNLSSLRLLISGGDELKASYISNLIGNLEIYNTYGPTESTVCVTYHKVTDLSDAKLIGTPISNREVYILDQNNMLLPKGSIGEICVGGSGLAKGYLNQETLTKEKFIKNPFKPQERLYKTGDLGKWLANGNIVFVGRKDDQVKIRGHRIELGEIEHALTSLSGIKEAIVLAKENEAVEKELIAYITIDKEQDALVGSLENGLNAETLSEFLNVSNLSASIKDILPDYMLPSSYVYLEEIPLTVNGKINKKALLGSNGIELTSGIEYVAPRNEIEENLIQIWQEILKKDTIGIDEGFFDVGGNSIKLMRLKSKIEKAFKCSLQVTNLFKYTTVRQQANMLSKDSLFENSSDTEIDDLVSVFESGGNSYNSTEIAVIGMAIQAPGSKNMNEFWDNLKNGKELIKHFTASELEAKGVSKKTLENKNYVRSNSYIEGKEYFDAGFFGYLPDEAKLMDPQTRIFHQVVWSALEDSGYNPNEYKGLIGLYGGAQTNTVWEVHSQLSGGSAIDSFSASNLSNKDFANTLIAHRLNLKGPVHSINTACSTSLVAIHQGVRSILSGETHMVIAGGVSLKNKPNEEGYMYQEGMIASKDGHNRAFDKDASGTLFGEGAGAVVLKKLSAAIKDGDQVYAVIKGSAINNDGNRKVGFTAPSIDGQSEVIKLAHKFAGVNPKSISYIEAHGTATKLGDPIEVSALTQAFGTSVDKYCALGSVKTNLGHLNTAAGVAGFIKTVLCLKNKKMVPSLHFKTPNPEINFEESPFYVNTKLKAWEKGESLRRAGVSSFGIGGTNAHIILEESPIITEDTRHESLELITLSSKTNESLVRQRQVLKKFLEKNKHLNLSDIAWTLQNRSAFSYRSSFVAQTIDQAIEFLDETVNLKKGNTHKGKKKVVFMFSGQGSQYQNMGRGLYEAQESVFSKTIEHCFEIASKHSNTDFKQILYPNEPTENGAINETINTQPILFMFEYALAKQMEHYGIVADRMIGHSIGEYVAASIAGVLELEEALKIVIKRGELMQTLPKGGMLALGVSANKIEKIVSSKIDIAAINTPESCVLSGPLEVIDNIAKELNGKEIVSSRLHTSHAFHSVMMEPILDEFTNTIDFSKINAPKIPYVSNVTGKVITAKELEDENYWANHIRGTVKFSEGIDGILSDENVILIEIGPGNVLANMVRQQLKKGKVTAVIDIIRHLKIKEEDSKFFLDKISDLWQSGLKINWNHLKGNRLKYKITLPTYSFEKIKYPTGQDVFKSIFEGLGQLNTEGRLEESSWYYESFWRKSKLRGNQGSKQEASSFLIFNDEGNIGQEMTRLLETSENNIVNVKIGAEFKKISEFEFEINPQEYKGYEDLFNELRLKQIHPSHIIHLLSLDNKEEENAEQNAVFGFYSLLHIAKELQKSESQKALNLSIITNKLEDVFDSDTVYPSKATMAGLSIVIAQENPLVKSKMIDLCLTSNQSNGIKALLNDVLYNSNEKWISYRNNKRWVKDYNALEMPLPSAENKSKIKNQGVYFITGGLGGLGFLYSKYLLEKYNASLILVGRSDLSNIDLNNEADDKLKKKKNRLISLNKIGNIAYHQANISDLASVRKGVEKGQEKFGKINGVIHAAGLTAGNTFKGINFLSVEECEKQFESKTKGAQVIGELFKTKELDFCLFTSSLASILGGKEFGAYAAANSYLDSYARNGLIKNSISINFDRLNFSEDQRSESTLNPDEIINVFETVLATDEDRQIIVSVNDLDYRIKKWVSPERDLESKELALNSQVSVDQNRSNLSAIYKEAESKTEKELCELFQSFFGINEVGIEDDFFELGGDSLKAMTLISRIHQKFDVQFQIREIMEFANIQNLAKEIELLTQINQMQQERETMNFDNKIEL